MSARIVAAVLAVAIVSSSFLCYGQAEKSEITISRGPDTSPLDELSFRVPPQAEEVSLTVYALNNSDKQVEAAFFQQLLDAKGQPTAGPTVKFEAAGSSDGKISIASKARIALTIDVQGLKDFGKFTGTITVDTGSGPRTVLPVTIEHYPEPELKIAGADGELALKAETTHWTYRLQIESTNLAAVDNLRVLIGPLNHPVAGQVQPKWKLDGRSDNTTVVPVPAHGAVDLDIEADLKAAGDYKGALTLLYGDKRDPILLTVTREHNVPSIKILEIKPIAATRFFETNFLVTIQETAGRDISLEIPTLVGVFRKVDAENKADGSAQVVKVQDASGVAVSSPFMLKADETKTLKLTLAGPGGAGEYSGQLRIGYANGPPADQQVSILVRDPWWLAALLILAGVVVSYLVRTWQKRGRPRLLALRDIQSLLDEIESIAAEAKPAAEESPPLKILRRRLEGLRQQVDASVPSTLPADLKEIGGKISLYPDWLNLSRQVEAIRPTNLADQFRPELQTIREYLSSETDKADPQTHRTTLTAMPARIRQVVAQEIATKLTAFRNELKPYQVRSTAATQARLNRIENALGEATKHLQSEEFAAARAQFDLARGEFVRLLLQELEEQLPETPPIGFDNDGWKTLRESLQAEIQELRILAGSAPEEAMEAYTILNCRRIRELARHVETQVPLIQTELDKIQDQNVRNTALGELTQAAQALKAAAENAEKGDLAAAAGKYEEGKQKFDDCRAKISKAGQQGAAVVVQAAHVARATAGASLVESAGQTDVNLIASRAARPTVEGLTKQLFLGELWFTIVLFVIATVVGVNMLWAGKPTWGDWPAWLTAFLWGLGTHQASSTALDISALTESLK